MSGRGRYTSDVDVTVSYVGATGIQLRAALEVPAYPALTTVSGRTTPGGRTAVLAGTEAGAVVGHHRRRRVRDHHGALQRADRHDRPDHRSGDPPGHEDVVVRAPHGHVRQGTRGPYPNRQVVVQTRVRGVPGAVFRTVATAWTTAAGYFYANWTAREDVDVRVAFLSTFWTISWSFAPTGAVEVI